MRAVRTPWFFGIVWGRLKPWCLDQWCCFAPRPTGTLTLHRAASSIASWLFCYFGPKPWRSRCLSRFLCEELGDFSLLVPFFCHFHPPCDCGSRCTNTAWSRGLQPGSTHSSSSGTWSCGSYILWSDGSCCLRLCQTPLQTPLTWRRLSFDAKGCDDGANLCLGYFLTQPLCFV